MQAEEGPVPVTFVNISDPQAFVVWQVIHIMRGPGKIRQVVEPVFGGADSLHGRELLWM